MKGNVIKASAVVALLLIGTHAGHSQGSFGNLNFETPILPLIPGANGKFPIANALPFWTGYLGGSQVDSIRLNDRAIDSADISLHNSLSPVLQPIEGNYTVLLLGSSMAAPTSSAVIGQFGQVPQDARSLVFFTTAFFTVEVTFAGEPIPLVQIGVGMNYVVAGGDVSQFAAQTGELRFTAAPGRGAVLDNIQFSPQAIPEPNIAGLSALGAGLLWWLCGSANNYEQRDRRCRWCRPQPRS